VRKCSPARENLNFRILRVVDNLKTILPHTAQKLHEYLGYEGQLFGTQHVVEYESVIEEEYARLE
jgi:hypothetical protein